ncbi:hypothetical protein VNO77_42883 [Canavalia gladiata]|uniref:Transmembrane protein n=1 Tax=Canavalia gladiata TaxID=3824 RepID=A0AAN9PNV9_CANGL
MSWICGTIPSKRVVGLRYNKIKSLTQLTEHFQYLRFWLFLLCFSTSLLLCFVPKRFTRVVALFQNDLHVLLLDSDAFLLPCSWLIRMRLFYSVPSQLMFLFFLNSLCLVSVMLSCVSQV